MPYVLHLRDSSGAALDRLVALGALDVETAADGGLTALMPDSVSPDAASAPGGGSFTTSAAIGRDGGSVWTLRPRPVRAGRLVIVTPAMHAEAGALPVILSDTPVFGTGLHPTTALCLEWLNEIVETDAPQIMLDVGTGSGILSLAALKLGVPRAVAIDIDEEAVRVAAENRRLNELRDRLVLTHGGPETVTGAFPLVIANVLAAPLIELAPVLVRRVGHHGRLVLSGIPQSVEGEVVRAYRRLGMHHVRTKARMEWTALLLQASW